MKWFNTMRHLYRGSWAGTFERRHMLTDHAGGAGHRCAAPVGANVPVGTFGHSTDPWTWEDGDRSC